MKTIIAFLIFTTMLISCKKTEDSAIPSDLANKLMTDQRLKTVKEQAEALISSGFNAGDGYTEVWIRDLNTFIQVACKVSDKSKLREALITFFKFQEEDGNILDGYAEKAKAYEHYKLHYSKLATGLAGHKNNVETDQESSLVQAVYKYIKYTGDKSILKDTVGNITVEKRMEFALEYLMKHRFDEKYGLLWGATTADWGDVQPETSWGVVIDSNSHFAIDIYDNAMFIIALNNYLELIEDKSKKDKWREVKESIALNVQKHLWDEKNQKFIPHIYLKDTPFPVEFNENEIYYHGGTAVAIEAALLSKEQVKEAYVKMKANVKAAGAQTIGLTLYPVYPQGYFKYEKMREYGYQNGGDWTWFGARMVQQLIAYGLYDEAYEAISPMLDRVIEHKGFYEWWTPAGEPKGSGSFRGSAGVLWTAIEEFEDVAKPI